MEWFSFFGHSIAVDILLVFILLFVIFYFQYVRRSRLMSSLQNSPTAIFLVNRHTGEVIDANHKAMQLLSIRRVGHRFLTPVHISPQQLVNILDAAQTEPNQIWNISESNKQTMHFSLNPMALLGRHVWLVHASFYRSHLYSGTNTSLLLPAFNALPDPIFIKDIDGNVLLTNPAYERFWYNREEEGAAMQAVNTMEERSSDRRWTTNIDGDSCLLETHFSPLITEKGQVEAMVGISHDVSGWYYTQQSYADEMERRHSTEQDYVRSETLLHSILQASPDPIVMFNKNRIYEACNQAYADSLGIVKVEDIIGYSLDDILPQPMADRLMESDLQVLEEKKTVRCIDKMTNLDGKSTWYDVLKAPYTEPFTGNTGCLLIARDVTEHFLMKDKLAEANKELERLSHFDKTLKIANKRNFDNQLRAVWLLHLRQHSSLTVMICDVDFFKHYQNHYGNKASKQVLLNIVSELNKVTQRGADLLAVGDVEDEFIFLLPETYAPECLLVAEKIHKIMAELKVAHQSSPISEYLTVSVGVASCTPQRSLKIESIVEAARDALFVAKQNGRNQTQLNSLYPSSNDVPGEQDQL